MLHRKKGKVVMSVEIKPKDFKFRHHMLKNTWYANQQRNLIILVKEYSKNVSDKGKVISFRRKTKKKIQKKGYVEKNKRYIQRVKTFVGCQSGFCKWQGKIPYGALHFHHRDPSTKLRNVSDMDSYALITIKKEMKKCDVLCGICHAIKESEKE